MKKLVLFAVFVAILAGGLAQASAKFNGLDMSMSTLSMLSDAKSRSITPENYTGEPGGGAKADPAGGEKRNISNAAKTAKNLGIGWKVNPYIKIAPGETFTLAEIEGSGAIQHIWMTVTDNPRLGIIRMYWDDETEASVECPAGDFFCSPFGEFAQLSSLAVCVNPGSAFNCYWKMPFRKKAKITFQNLNTKEVKLFYQIDYALAEVSENEAYFHAQFRRSNTTKGSLHTLVDGIKGKGHYVGTFMAWRVHNNGWWGEGEIKFYMDNDKDFPTICGTGAEDYFCGSYNFENKATKQYQEFCTPYAGMHQVVRPDGLYKAVMAFGMYRWHIMDPVRFENSLKVTIQDLGWNSSSSYSAQSSDISSVAFWYQNEPHSKFPQMPPKDALEIR